MYCTNCGKEISDKAVACPSCGFSPKSEKNYCYECGAPTKEKQIICTNCGVELNNISKGNNIELPKLGNNISKLSIILSIIGSILLMISIFLPWVQSSISGYGQHFSSQANGLETGHGYYIILSIIAIIILIIIKSKYLFIPAIFSLLDGLIVITGIGSKSLSFSGASVSSGFSIGPVLVIIASLLVILAPFINLRHNNNDSDKNKFKNTILKIIKTDYFKIGLPIFLFVLSILVNTSYSQYYEFPLFEIILLIYPLYYAYKKHKIFIPLIISLIGIQIITYIPIGFLRCYKSLCIEIANSIAFAINITFYVFIILLIITIIDEINKSEIIPKSINEIINKFKLIQKSWIYIWSSFLIILIIALIINLSSLVSLSDSDKQEIVEPFNKICGDWVFSFDNNKSYYNVTIDSANINVVNDYGKIEINQNLIIKGDDNNHIYKYKQDCEYDDLNTSFPFDFSDYYKNITILKDYKDSMIVIKVSNNDTLHMIAYRKKYFNNLIEQIRQKEEEEYLKTYNDIEYEENLDTIDSSIVDTVNTDTLINNEEITWYKINDPDGYTNLRNSPGGKVIRKVYLNEKFEILLKETKYSKVKLEDGTAGYIHNSRIQKL